MSKESKKYANPVRKAKYEDDGVKDAPIILFREPGRKPVIKDAPIKLFREPGRKPVIKDAPIILFREPGRKPAPKSGTLKRGKKKTKK